MRIKEKTVLLLVVLTVGASATAADLPVRLRRPVAIAASLNEEWIYTANRDSGSITNINVSNRSVAGEVEVGGQLADLAVLDDSHILVLDAQPHQLNLLTGSGAEWEVSQRLKVPEHPGQLIVDRKAGRCFVTSLWSRVVTAVSISNLSDVAVPRLSVSAKADVSFEPRELCLSADGKRLIVAGAFENTFAVFTAENLRFVFARTISGHNTRGLTVSADGKKLLIAHQHLNALAHSSEDDVHWGNMLANVLTTCDFDEFCNSSASRLKSRTVGYLGEPGNAAGDPGEISVTPDGQLAVLFAGVNEVGISTNEDHYEWQRITVGSRPSAMARLSDGTIFVANRFSDSVSVIDAKKPEKSSQISLGPQPKLSHEQTGEVLFFDSRLSHDGWMSCHSCHTDGHTNGMLNDNLSDGNFGDPKRVLSLLGVAETGPWAWDGQVITLEDQVRNSIQKTMQGSMPDENDVSALVAYLKSLPAQPQSQKPRDELAMTMIQKGRELFRSFECKRCHTPPAYTSAGPYDVGFEGTKFNPPSLRGVGHRKALFHDSRADSLTAVLTEFRHQLPRELTDEEVGALVRFLKTL